MGPESAPAAPDGRREPPGPGIAGAESDGTSEEQDGTTGRQRRGPPRKGVGIGYSTKGQSEKGTQDFSEKLRSAVRGATEKVPGVPA